MGGLRPPKHEKGDFIEWLEYESREGCRGGQANFSWDKLRSDKDRVFYVGNSLRVTDARANMGKDLLWWTEREGKERGSRQPQRNAKQAVEQSELELIKQQERDALNAALARSSDQRSERGLATSTETKRSEKRVSEPRTGLATLDRRRSENRRVDEPAERRSAQPSASYASRSSSSSSNSRGEPSRKRTASKDSLGFSNEKGKRFNYRDNWSRSHND